jgi:endonuclease-3
MPNNSMDTIPWDQIFFILEAWQKGLSDAGFPVPSVSALSLEVHSEQTKAWVVLVSTIISLRTKDEVTIASSRRLLEKAPGPQKLLQLPKEIIAKLIYPAGFYRTKAEHLVQIAAILVDRYHGRVPENMEELLALPGVGRKTANLVLSEGFEQDAICVDTHVHRICNRTGWLHTKTPEETEYALRTTLPRLYWRRINWLLVLFGQQVCRPQSPYCSRCPLADHCIRRDVLKSR